MFSQNWFEAVVEVVMEKPVSLAQLIPLNLVSKNVLRMPFLTLGVIARIHWQALRLWLKRVKFYRHSAPL